MHVITELSFRVNMKMSEEVTGLDDKDGQLSTWSESASSTEPAGSGPGPGRSAMGASPPPGGTPRYQHLPGNPDSITYFILLNTFYVVRKGKVLSLHDTAMLLCFCFCLISQLLCNLAIKSRALRPGLLNPDLECSERVISIIV